MPDDERTEYHTPIPLRRNGLTEQPNPYTRLEAVEAVRKRLEALRALFMDPPMPLRDGDAAAVLQDLICELAGDVHASLWDDLQAVEAVRDRRPTGAWLRRWALRLWPE